MCHVNEKFRCIVLVDENKLEFSDPPFLNRFEKQMIVYLLAVFKMIFLL